jgi:hypothetical protein
VNRELQEPWDVPPHPAHGDPDSIMTYAAKGRAVCAWERLESALGYLFAILSGKDWGDDEAADIYGAAGNFHERFRRLREAKDRFFILHHCQRLEGDLDELLKRVEGFQPRRNEITHSIIVYCPDQSGEGAEYFLLPPHFSTKKFDANSRPKFVYTSVAIEEFADYFQALGGQIDLLGAQLSLELNSL